MLHSLSIVDKAGKTAIQKAVRGLGFSLISSQFFTAQADKLPLDLIKAGGIKDTCLAHHLPAHKPGDKTKQNSTTYQRLNEHREQVIARVRSLTKSLYKCSQSSWAGGDTMVRVSYDSKPSASGRSERQWSKNGKWSGNDAHLSLSIMPAWDKAIEAVPRLKDAAGMLTTHAKQVGSDLWEASWIRQGRGFDLVSESGVILRVVSQHPTLGPCTEWIHAKNEKSARGVLSKRKTAEQQLRSAHSQADYARSLSPTDMLALYPSVEVCLRDSIAAGNCESGTLSWREKYGFSDKTCATVAEILATNDTSNYVLRAIRAALIRAKVAPQQQAA